MYMLKQKPKNVFAIIDLAIDENEQTNVARYAAQLANHLELGLVLYPKLDKATQLFNFRTAIQAAREVANSEVIIAKQKKSALNFSSIHDVAATENAAFIVMGIDKKSVLFLGATIWSMAQKTIIPTILLPKGIEFSPYHDIVIALDYEQKMQKLITARNLAKHFNSTVSIFAENHKNLDTRYTLYQIQENMVRYLTTHSVAYKTIQARQTKNFMKHLCKFAAKNADILIVEVDPGRIDSEVKKNIETLLTLVYPQEPHDPTQPKAKPTPVMVIKTEMLGTLRYH